MVTAAAKTILLIEDELDIREALAEVLISEGYAVQSAANGQEGLDLLQNHPSPSLILLDLMMPILDGWAFLSRRMADPQMQHLPVIIMSAADRKRPVGPGLTFIRKPIDLSDLLKKISENCR
jgi:CheY-like chemotaxis protein